MRHFGQAKYAKMNMLLSKIARIVGFTGRMADVETPRRRLEREERKASCRSRP